MIALRTDDVQKEHTFTGSQENKALLIGLRVSWTMLQTMMIMYRF
jgi:hypothetical protein